MRKSNAIADWWLKQLQLVRSCEQEPIIGLRDVIARIYSNVRTLPFVWLCINQPEYKVINNNWTTTDYKRYHVWRHSQLAFIFTSTAHNSSLIHHPATTSPLKDWACMNERKLRQTTDANDRGLHWTSKLGLLIRIVCSFPSCCFWWKMSASRSIILYLVRLQIYIVCLTNELSMLSPFASWSYHYINVKNCSLTKC